MRVLHLWILLLVPMFSAQTWAQTDTLVVEEEVIREESEQQEKAEKPNDNSIHTRTKGFVDTYHALATERHGKWMASRTRLRREITFEKGAAALFVSMNATYNAIVKDRTGVELREAYLSYAKGGLDLRVGRQIVVWGVADALRITDCVSPCDYTEFLAQDYDDIRMPVNGLRAKYTYRNVTFEAVCNPVADFFILPIDESNPWAVSLTAATLPCTIDLESGKPAKKLRNLEWGGRISANLSGIDFSVSALRTWNKMPAMELALSTDGKTLLATGRYPRMTMLGADCSLPVGQFVVRGETACYLGEAQTTASGREVVRRNTFNALLGADWYPGSDWNISLQYCHRRISGDKTTISAYRNTGLATARISKELLRNLLKLSTFAYIDVSTGGIFNRFSASYALTDQIELAGGYDYFHADRGRFAIYGKNSEAWVKLKYSF